MNQVMDTAKKRETEELIASGCLDVARVQEKAKNVQIKALALTHSQQCMAHHGTGPEVQAAWIEFCKCVDVYEER